MENVNCNKSMSEDEKWELIKTKVWSIENIENPTEEMCIYCVKNAWNTLKLIKNPSKKTISEAVRANGWALQFVQNPTEEQKILAVTSTYDAIKYIQRPSVDVQLAAVKNNYRAIKYIDAPALKVKIAAVAQNPSAITSFNYTDKEFYILLRYSLAILKYVSDYDNDIVIGIIKYEISKGSVSPNFIYEFIKLEVLKIDKINFVYKFGSDNAKKYYVDYNLDM
ncbi:hypothetical protein [Clostridium oryzae]|uniref:DUF4116 domain-containing protein n=1 Tax=Clostridium oryzae TaxID=1450648 RepID=A0A1V4IRL4_9CLOT|nr:hypothetical protein [Clostridium oryzae]OPJ62435.1 hypothetical protein CLORY_18040 [Clostridium oryzae]